jgi:hypothetical protein
VLTTRRSFWLYALGLVLVAARLVVLHRKDTVDAATRSPQRQQQ